MSYVYRVIYSETASQKLTDVAWATYLYARAAITYKNQKWGIIMETKYTTPEMEIITFDNEDVITTSDPELEPQ